MKFSLKHYILLFAVGMMSVVACSDDDDDETTPAAGGGGNGGGPSPTTEQIIANVDGEDVDFDIFATTIDMSGPDDIVRISGTSSTISDRIGMSFKKSFKGTATYPQATEEVITYVKDGGATYLPLSGSLVVNRNDSIVAGTFDFVGKEINTLDTITVTNGEFYLEL